LFGLLIRFSGGKRAIDAILPPIVTGSVAAVIGVALGKAALDMASGTAGGIAGGSLNWWAAAMVTLLATILFSVYLQGKGFIGMLPILLGAIVGYLVAIPLGLANLQPVAQAKLIVLPHITLPSFSGELAATAVIGIAVMAIATIPESTTHLYFDPGQLAIGATILIVGIGGHIGYPDGFLPIPLLQGIFPRGWPAIATAAVAGILLNLIFSLFKPATVRPHVEADVELKPGAAD
jgi:xanthine/uracil permease